MSKVRYRLVIDTSVARAAGEAASAASSVARQTLQDVLTICHQAVMCEQLLREWRRHRSRFAARWLVSMFARKKIVPLNTDELPDLSLVLDACGADKQRAIVAKDLHLVQAAQATDKRVLSYDDEAGLELGKLSSQVGLLRSISWMNPARCNSWGLPDPPTLCPPNQQ